jgi:hypothetical protein
MKINQSVDWDLIGSRLFLQVSSLPYNVDLHRIYTNISGMIAELSKLEVDARRIRKIYVLDEKVAKINEAIDRLEKLLLMAKLIS